MVNLVINKRSYVMKSMVLDTIIADMKAGGWEDISSNPTTDFWVMHSDGESGADSLTIQIRPYFSTNVAASNIVTGTGQGGSFRQLIGYVPGSTGTAGTFTRATDIFYSMTLFNAAGIAGNTPDCEVSSYVDKDRCLFVVRNNRSAADSSPVVIGFGVPDNKYREPIIGSRDMIYFSSTVATDAATPASTGAGTLIGLDYPTGWTMATAPLVYHHRLMDTFRNPTVNSRYVLSPILYGSATLPAAPGPGPLGELWGIYGMFNVTPVILDRDIIIAGGNRYEVLVTSTVALANALPTRFLAVQVAEHII